MLSCTSSGFCLSRGVWRGADGELGGPGGDQSSSQPLPAASCLRATCIQQFQTSCQNYFEQHYCWVTCVKWKRSSVDITQPHPPEGKPALLRKQCLFCIFLRIKEMAALVAKHTPERHIYKAPGTLPLSNLIHKTAALYESPLALMLSRTHSPRCPAKGHAPFSLFLSFFYPHPAKMFSMQEAGLVKDRERWSLGENSRCAPKVDTSHVSGSSSTGDAGVQVQGTMCLLHVLQVHYPASGLLFSVKFLINAWKILHCWGWSFPNL